MVEERAVAQEGKRLGVAVTDAEVTAAFDALDREVRTKTGGHKNLRQVIEQEQKVPLQEFLDNLRHQLVKEKVAGHPANLGRTLPKDPEARIAQTEVVIGEVMKRAKVEYGWKTALQETPTPMGPEVVASVNGESITMQQYGEQLLRRLPPGEVKEILLQECKAALTGQVALPEEEMAKVIAEEEQRWNRFREMTTQEAYRALSYEEYMRLKFKLDLDQIKQDRYFRGLFGLVRQEREKVVEQQRAAATSADDDVVDEVRKEWEQNRETLWATRSS